MSDFQFQQSATQPPLLAKGTSIFNQSGSIQFPASIPALIQSPPSPPLTVPLKVFPALIRVQTQQELPIDPTPSIMGVTEAPRIPPPLRYGTGLVTVLESEGNNPSRPAFLPAVSTRTQRTGDQLEVGDVVRKLDNSPIRNGTDTFIFAVVVSTAPFVLTTYDASTRWQYSVKADEFVSIGRATQRVIDLCMSRLDN